MPLSVRSILLIMAVGSNSLFGQPRYLAHFAGGERIEAEEIEGWHDLKATPIIAGRLLFDRQNPVVTLFDRKIPAGKIRGKGVYFTGGDFIPGIVKGGVPPRLSELQPEHLLIEPAFPWQMNESPSSGPLRILADSIQRISWVDQPTQHFSPQTLFLRDGRRFQFRAFQWQGSEFHILEDEETKRFILSEIAEIHFEQVDPFAHHLRELAHLVPEGEGPWFQIETAAGLCLTASFGRFQIRTGTPERPQSWLHGFQPVWALDPIWVSHREIRVRRYYSPKDLPLSRLEPIHFSRSPGLSLVRHYGRNRQVNGERIFDDRDEAPTGFGLWASARLTWKIPREVVAFQTGFRLDPSVGEEGSARGEVWLGYSNSPTDLPVGEILYRSPIQNGRMPRSDSPLIPITHSPETEVFTYLTLVADSAAEEENSLLDIGDRCAFHNPRLELDLQKVRESMGKLEFPLIAWRGWNSEGPFQLVPRLDVISSPQYRFVDQLATQETGIRWTRSLEPVPHERFLALFASRFPDDTESVRVRVDARRRIQSEQELLGEFELPIRGGRIDPLPVLVPVPADSALLFVTQLAGGEKSLADWRGVALVRQPPGVKILGDESAEWESWEGGSVLRSGIWSNESAYQTESRGVWKGDPVSIREYPRFGEYRFIRFYWKSQERMAVRFAYQGEYGPEVRNDRNARTYEAGGEPRVGWQIDAQPPREWTMVTRDLWADFGAGELTGISFESNPNSQAEGGGSIDLIALGRTYEELDHQLPIRQTAQTWTLFDENEEFYRRIDGLVSTNEEKGLVVTARAGGAFRRPQIPGYRFAIREKPGPGEFRYVQFAWKSARSERLALEWIEDREGFPRLEDPKRVVLDTDPQPQPRLFFYEAGPLQIEQSQWKTIRVQETAPDDWVLVTRDLFADFGEFTITGIGFHAMGADVQFDRIKLFRERP